MTRDADTTTVLRSVRVPVPPAEAFRLFTERFGDIKPREHNLLSSPIVSTTLHPGVGGDIVDRGEDGSECRWARILAWEPPTRLVFSWDITLQWSLETDPDRTSEVEVSFVADGDGTRVELEHRSIENHGPGWPAMRDSVGDDQGWSLYLDRFASLVP